jgi:hypothetical protein
VYVGLRRSFTAVEDDFDFLRAPSGIGQGLRDVLGFKIGILAKKLFLYNRLTACSHECSARSGARYRTVFPKQRADSRKRSISTRFLLSLAGRVARVSIRFRRRSRPLLAVRGRQRRSRAAHKKRARLHRHTDVSVAERADVVVHSCAEFSSTGCQNKRTTRRHLDAAARRRTKTRDTDRNQEWRGAVQRRCVFT